MSTGHRHCSACGAWMLDAHDVCPNCGTPYTPPQHTAHPHAHRDPHVFHKEPPIPPPYGIDQMAPPSPPAPPTSGPLASPPAHLPPPDPGTRLTAPPPVAALPTQHPATPAAPPPAMPPPVAPGQAPAVSGAPPVPGPPPALGAPPVPPVTPGPPLTAPVAPVAPAGGLTPRVDPYLRHATPNAEWTNSLHEPVTLSFDKPRPTSEVTVEKAPARPNLVRRLVIAAVVVALGVVGFVQREAIGDAAKDGYDWIADRFGDEPEATEPG